MKSDVLTKEETKRRMIECLDGEWEAAESVGPEPPESFGRRVRVPGLIDMAAPGFEEVGLVSDKRRYFWYRTVVRESTEIAKGIADKEEPGTGTLPGLFHGDGPDRRGCLTGDFVKLVAIQTGEWALRSGFGEAGADPVQNGVDHQGGPFFGSAVLRLEEGCCSCLRYGGGSQKLENSCYQVCSGGVGTDRVGGGSVVL